MLAFRVVLACPARREPVPVHTVVLPPGPIRSPELIRGLPDNNVELTGVAEPAQ